MNSRKDIEISSLIRLDENFQKAKDLEMRISEINLRMENIKFSFSSHYNYAMMRETLKVVKKIAKKKNFEINEINMKNLIFEYHCRSFINSSYTYIELVNMLYSSRKNSQKNLLSLYEDIEKDCYGELVKTVQKEEISKLNEELNKLKAEIFCGENAENLELVNIKNMRDQFYSHIDKARKSSTKNIEFKKILRVIIEIDNNIRSLFEILNVKVEKYAIRDVLSIIDEEIIKLVPFTFFEVIVGNSEEIQREIRDTIKTFRDYMRYLCEK